MLITQPFLVADRYNQFDVFCTVIGGGLSGQAGAVRHGISRALTYYEPDLRGILKVAGFLTRDSRVRRAQEIRPRQGPPQLPVQQALSPEMPSASLSAAPAFKGGLAPAVFIDGEAGTTGLGIRQRLAGLDTVSLLSIAPEARKDPAARQALMERADLVILCLPDEAAREAAALAEALGPDAPRVLDASSAHRTAPGWVFGFPELSPGQAAAIGAARQVSNPGCYATGAIAIAAPAGRCGHHPAGPSAHHQRRERLSAAAAGP